MVSRYPRWVLACGAVLALLSVVLAATQLGFQGDRNDLLSRELWWNQLYLEWNDRFTARDDLVVLIDMQPSGPKAIPPHAVDEAARQAVVNDVGRALAHSPLTDEVLWRVPLSEFTPRAARLQNVADYHAQLEQAVQARPMLESATPTALINHITSQLQATGQTPSSSQSQSQTQTQSDGEAAAAPDAAASLEQLATLLSAIQAALRPTGDDPQAAAEPNPFQRLEATPRPTDVGGASGYRYFHNAAQDLYYLRVSPRASEGDINPFLPAIQEVRAVLGELSARYPGIEMGVTGVKVIEADETMAATRDTTLASVVATILIAMLLITAFHSVRTPLLGLVALGFAIAWTFGFATLAIGHLQVLSVIFTLVLLGLGIDFAVHLTTRLELVRHDHPDTTEGFQASLAETLRTAGPGVVTGAVTTSVAFAMTLVTDFQGVREMGMIAGAGVLLCLLSMVTVLPALQARWGRRYRHMRPMTQRTLHLFDGRWLTPILHHPKITLGVAAVLAVLSAYAVTQIRYDFNLLKLQAPSAAGVIWMNKLADRTDEGTFYGISIADSLEEAQQRARAFMELEHVSGVGGIGLLVPENDALKRTLAADARAALGEALTQALPRRDEEAVSPPPADLNALQTQLRLLQLGLSRELPADADHSMQQGVRQVHDNLESLLSTLTALPAEERDAAAQRLTRLYTAWRAQLAQQLQQLTDGQPLQISDVPYPLVAPSISDTGQFAIEVYPQLATQQGRRIDAPLDPQVMARFAADVLTVDPEMTGPMLQIYRSGILMLQAYQKAGLLALLAVFVLVWLDFRSFHDAVLTLVPVAVGFGVTFAIMWLMDMTLNPANIIVLPLMFGIGVDSGVHLMHRYNQHPTDLPPGLAHGTGKGITVTSLTTMIAFGVMIPARHQGISSLGVVLTLGIGMTLLACCTIMPAYLTLRNRWRHARANPTT